MSRELVLVTGGTGFIGQYSILRLLAEGYTVRTTVRDLSKKAEIIDILDKEGARAADLSIVEANLTSDEGWRDATAGCSFVLHVASPLPVKMPKNPDDLVVPAREGTLRVLEAARISGVKRVVMTSSFAAIAYGHGVPGKVFTEKDWTELAGQNLNAYVKSKTVSERAAWNYVESVPDSPELAVVNPVVVLGPVLGLRVPSSVELIRRMLEGKIPGLPKISLGLVDVRDVADLHYRAMVHPSAAGERFLAVGDGFKTMEEIAGILKDHPGIASDRVPDRVVPDWLLRAAGLFLPDLRTVLPELGIQKDASNRKACEMLGWNPRSGKDAILAAAKSLMERGLLKAG